MEYHMDQILYLNDIAEIKNYKFIEIFDLEEIQRLQDLFSAATGVASIITEPDGTPITRPSGFGSFCEVIRKTEKGSINCRLSNTVLCNDTMNQPVIRKCLSGGLIQAGVSIIIEGHKLANWLIGQILYEDSKMEDLFSYADEIGVNRDVFKQELTKVKRIPKSQFEGICNFLCYNVQKLSEYAVHNVCLAQEINKRVSREIEFEELNLDLARQVRERTNELFKKNVMLSESNSLLSAIIESSSHVIVFALDTNYNYLAFNKRHEDTIWQIWGKEIETGTNMLEIIGKAKDRRKAKACFDRALKGESFTVSENYGDEMPARLFWQNYYSPILSDNNEIIGLTCFCLNITSLVQARSSLTETKAILQAALDNSQAGIAIVDKQDGKLKYINETGLIILNEEKDEYIRDIHIDEYFMSHNKILCSDGVPYKTGENPFSRAVFEGQACSEEFIVKRNGFENTIVWANCAPLKDEEGGVKSGIVVFLDISERKKAEQEIVYLSYHDKLTGLYNRRFYEEEIKRIDIKRNLPISIVMADVNGLKLVNDAFGHAKGDVLLQKAAAAIQSVCRKNDIVARWGGDEFVILLPETNSIEAEAVIDRIKAQYLKEHIGNLKLGISFGWDTKIMGDQDILKILKSAEDNMYRNKILKNEVTRGNTINAIIKTLNEKNPREEQHSKRVSEICQNLGKEMGLSDFEVSKLKMIGLVHDIGKIAIEDGILNKPDKLTDQEWKEIERHPEIGYRILSTSNEMLELAEGILAHHERWDGKGYPKGLKGEEIPLTARIIALADSYDAMSNERPYRSILREDEVLEEIRKNIGKQFDPNIAKIFLEKVLKKPLHII